MAGNYVFPGGVVDPQDGEVDFWDRHTDLDSAALGRRLGGAFPVAEAMAYAITAIRETFEEAGVLLIQTDQSRLVTWSKSVRCAWRRTSRKAG